MSERRWRLTRAEGLAALVGAVLFSLSFPPVPVVVPVLFCLVPVALIVIRAADEQAGWRVAARVGVLFGVLAYGIALYWLASALRVYTDLAFLGFIGALIVLTPVVTITMIALYVARRVTRWPAAVLLPVVWVASEVLLDYLPQLGFPWLPLGLAVAKHPVLAQAADLSGVRGLSFCIAAINGLIVDAWLLRARRRAVWTRAGAIAAIACVAALYGWWRMRTITFIPVGSVAVVQPNIPQSDKWQEQYQGRIVGILSSLSRQVLSHDSAAALLLWPEAALPDNFSAHPEWADTMRTIARTYDTPVLFGTIDVVWHSPTDYDYYNAALLADTLGRIGTQPAYHKSYLVPVVERVPIVNPRWFASFRFFGGMGRGQRPHVFDLRLGKVGVLICYESIFLERSRFYRRQGATILVNITNDAWFGRSVAVYQHEAHLALRAIENRVGVVRDANTGISEYVDPLGRSHGATGLFVPGALAYQAQTTNILTLYDHVGDWVGMLCSAATLVLIAIGVRRRYVRSRP